MHNCMVGWRPELEFAKINGVVWKLSKIQCNHKLGKNINRRPTFMEGVRQGLK